MQINDGLLLRGRIFTLLSVTATNDWGCKLHGHVVLPVLQGTKQAALLAREVRDKL